MPKRINYSLKFHSSRSPSSRRRRLVSSPWAKGRLPFSVSPLPFPPAKPDRRGPPREFLSTRSPRSPSHKVWFESLSGCHFFFLCRSCWLRKRCLGSVGCSNVVTARLVNWIRAGLWFFLYVFLFHLSEDAGWVGWGFRCLLVCWVPGVPFAASDCEDFLSTLSGLVALEYWSLGWWLGTLK